MSNEKRIFEIYKRELIEVAEISRAGKNELRFNGIQYLCSFPSIDPVKMAASLQHDGFTILYDDSSISKQENDAHRLQVERAARRI